MKRYLEDLCQAVDIEKVMNLDLLALSEECAVLEERVYALADRLPLQERELLKDYIHTRNDLECEALNTALRWGMLHPKKQVTQRF